MHRGFDEIVVRVSVERMLRIGLQSHLFGKDHSILVKDAVGFDVRYQERLVIEELLLSYLAQRAQAEDKPVLVQ